MPSAFRTLTLWSAWLFAAIAIYTGLYLETDLNEFLHQDESRITWIILLLFIIGLVSSLIITILVTREHLEANQQELLARENGLMKLGPTGRRHHKVNHFYTSLKVVASGNEKPDLETLVELEFASYHRMTHGIEVLGNLLITLGLIGTVMGLTYTLTGLTTSLDALGHDQEKLVAGLRTAMGGMGTAFYTTLLGAILGGVLLRIFALINENGISALQERLIKTCMIYLNPDFRPSVERDLRFLNVEIDALETKVEQLNAAFAESTKSIEAFQRSINNLNEFSGDDKSVYTLRETLHMQKYYRLLLKQELQLMHRLNRSWWQRFKDHLPARKKP